MTVKAKLRKGGIKLKFIKKKTALWPQLKKLGNKPDILKLRKKSLLELENKILKFYDQQKKQRKKGENEHKNIFGNFEKIYKTQ
eukprot:UN33958